MSVEKQAFPCHSVYRSDPGMTLRDYFAAHAMAAFINSNGRIMQEPWEIAQEAYHVADAMLSFRPSDRRTGDEDSDEGHEE